MFIEGLHSLCILSVADLMEHRTRPDPKRSIQFAALHPAWTPAQQMVSAQCCGVEKMAVKLALSGER